MAAGNRATRGRQLGRSLIYLSCPFVSAQRQQIRKQHEVFSGPKASHGSATIITNRVISRPHTTATSSSAPVVPPRQEAPQPFISVEDLIMAEGLYDTPPLDYHWDTTTVSASSAADYNHNRTTTNSSKRGGKQPHGKHPPAPPPPQMTWESSYSSVDEWPLSSTTTAAAAAGEGGEEEDDDDFLQVLDGVEFRGDESDF